MAINYNFNGGLQKASMSLVSKINKILSAFYFENHAHLPVTL